MALLDSQSRPLGSLTSLFTLWKLFVLTIALAASLTPDYDTSTSLFFHRVYGAQPAANASLLAQKLTRWDALYFMHASRVGKVYEQEWAFGTGLSGLVSGSLSVLPVPEFISGGVAEPLAAIAISHASHLFSVLALYKLTVLVSKDARLSFVAACLHIISPAGLFLSAPYAESTFSCLSFLGYWVFALSQKSKGDSINSAPSSFQSSGYVVLSGVLFGLATIFRSNGLACGLLFAVDAVRSLITVIQRPTFSTLVSLVAPLLGGLLIVAGYAAPQVLAWSRYCVYGVVGDLPQRPWCTKTIPSIYSFVQEHYWDVGFLKYWTLNQLPLFLLASPVLALLITSGIQILREPSSSLKQLTPARGDEHIQVFVRTLAAAQAFVALLALTTYHVQIINRLASGYVIWYWWIAGCILDERGRWGLGSYVTMFFVLYAGVQGGLFASFLPPA